MVAPWSEVAAALRPNFTMTGDTAATMVLPTTEGVNQASVSAFSAGLALGVSVKGGAGASPPSSPTVPTAPSGAPANASAPSAATPGALALDSGLKYDAAQFLSEKVALLNNEISYIASRDCFTPYVVKLKVAIMAYRSHLPYSVNAHISFLPKGDVYKENKFTSLYESAGCSESYTPVAIPMLVADNIDVASKANSAEVARQLSFAIGVMSHLVGGNVAANNLDETLKNISNNALTSTVTVGLETQNSINVQISPENLESGDASLVTQTHDVAVILLVPRNYFKDINILLEQNKLEEKTLSAHLSVISYTEFHNATDGNLLPPPSIERGELKANQILTSFMLGENHEKWSKIKPIDKLNILNKLTNLVQTGDYFDFKKNVTTVGVSTNCPTVGISVNCVTWRFQEFETSALWAAVSSAVNDYTYRSSTFDVPAPTPVRYPSQTVAVVDDGSHPVQATIAGFEAATSAPITATLDFTPLLPRQPAEQAAVDAKAKVLSDAADKAQATADALAAKAKKSKTAAAKTAAAKAQVAADQAKAGAADAAADASKGAPSSRPIRVAAQSIVLDTTNHLLTLSFPSLSKLGFRGADERQPSAINISSVSCDEVRQLCPRIGKADIAAKIVLEAKADPNPGKVTLAANAGVLQVSRATHGATPSGLVPVVVTSLPTGETAALTVTGADVVQALDAAGKALQINKNGYVVSAAGTYALNLVNLVPGATVTVSVQGIKSGASDGFDPAKATYTVVRD
jgi:hypothetical protein